MSEQMGEKNVAFKVRVFQQKCIQTPLQQSPKSQKKEKRRKMSNTFQRISKNNPNPVNFDKVIVTPKTVPFKIKVTRKDSSETSPTVADNCMKSNMKGKPTTIAQLFKNAKDDPFLKKKLQRIFTKDLKTIANSTYKTDPSLNKSIDNIVNDKSTLNNVVSFISDRFQVSKDLSSEGSILDYISQCDLSQNTVLSNTSQSKRLEFDFMDEDLQTTRKNQRELGSKFTTFRKENFKTRLSKIQLLRDLNKKQEEKQEKINESSFRLQDV